jgi:alpha-2-macroglobulin-like protein
MDLVYPFNFDAMKKSTFQSRFTLVILMTLLSFLPALAQQHNDYAANKEKIYIQTNHSFFKPGDQAYFKVYVVNARSQKPSQASMSVYTEIISPSGTVVQKQHYKVDDGYAEGSYDFGEDVPGGLYKIRAYTSWMQNENEGTYFTKEITVQKVIAPRILMKLDFTGKAYGAGDEVAADFSMRNLADMPIKQYPGKFTVSIGGEAISSVTFNTDNDGKANVRFKLPKTLKTNDGLLNITINYDSYTEAISRSIPIVLNKIDLQFMPESGTLVEGVPTWVAFKALNENGKAADVKGDVLDNAGNKIASFESYHFGMGKFEFTPKKGVSYKVKLTSPSNITDTYSLPQVNQSGIVMNVSKTGDAIHVILKTNQPQQIKLEGRSRDHLYYSSIIDLKNGESRLSIDENLFPVGIAQFTISNGNNIPLAERLYFLNEDRNLNISITTDRKKYLPREKVKMTIFTTDENGKPVPANLSLSVMDDKLWTFADDKQDHILSWLLMSSELRGKVEEPQFYFKKEEAKAIPALDLVMMTHGYRYFDYIEYVKTEGKLKYMADQERMLSGKVVNALGKPVKANIFLVNASNQDNARRTQTGADGLFFFSELTSGLDYYLLAQSTNKKDKVTINILQNGVGFNPMNGINQRRMLVNKDDNDAVAALFKKDHVVRREKRPGAVAAVADVKAKGEAFMWDNEMAMDKAKPELQEVVVVGFGQARKRDMVGAVAQVRGDEIVPVANNFMGALQGRVPGINIVNENNVGAAPTINIRGSRSLSGNTNPLVVLDGIPMEEYKVNSLNTNDIESVSVLKDAAATTIYGSRAVNGVIVIESKKFRNEKIRFKFSNEYYYASQALRSSGPVYTAARRFYAPVYATTETEERSDFRETIFWNPVVSTDEEGKAVVEFYNSDASTTFRAIAEGIGYNGKAGRAEATYTSQNAMSIDAKIPPYLTVGDKALLPVVIKNNRDIDIAVSLNAIMPAKLKAGKYDSDFMLKPDESRQILVPVEAIDVVKDVVRFVVRSGNAKETMILPITASGKGFPVVYTFAGNESKQHQFIINKAIPGSIKTDLRIFKNLEGQLLDGIESMLREPGGCFEQTSSSLYPNIYVLKYLRTAGKSNPEIEAKAMGYIERGYKRLAGYETKLNGFEWFGNTPPHEALTAYGLLEFTDMQEFFDVDKQMIERTKKFLLDRRDGNGQFKLAKGGYDQFASVPDKIANLYIVYALTQAGIGKEIQKEYETAVKQALASNDGYLLSMMALAASNMKNAGDYDKLMAAANAHYKKTQMAAETSVTNSRESSLKVETLSFYALALMRQQDCSVISISPIISSILAEKTYYGYGATQATVLALQAIVEYSKLAQRITMNTQMLFTTNNDKTGNGADVMAKLTEGNNRFAVAYEKEGNNIPYSLEVSYNTYVPPNSEKAELKLNTRIANSKPKIGETTRMEIEVTNDKNMLQAMSIAKIGIPAGLSAQPWQLKEIMEKNQVAYYEIFDNYLVLYWMGFAGHETKKIGLDLKAEIAGTYKAKASNTYLYYMPEHKNWNEGIQVEVQP